MQNRRHLQRWQLQRKARIRLDGQEECADCQIIDINLKGLKFSCSQALGRDKHIAFTLILSPALALHLQAWVAWQRAVGGSYLYGLYFTKIRDEDKEAIYQFVRGNLPQEIKKLWWEDFPAQEKGGRQMEEEKTVDRRVFERFPAEVAVRMLDTQSGQELQAKSVDISAKGLGLLAQQNLHLGAEVELWLQIPGSSEPLYNRGTLVWSTPQPQGQFRMGINLEKAELMGVGKLLRTRY